MRFGSKVPGSAMEVREVSMDFLYGAAFTESSPEAYERLLLDVLLGDSDAVPRPRRGGGVLAGDRPARGVLGRHGAGAYRAGEWGPRAADEMLAREGRTWRRP